MQLELIIAALKQRCPSFADRVAGAANFKVLPETAKLAVPSAFVLPVDDSPDANEQENGTFQRLRDTFAVVVAISNTADERGQIARRSVHALRSELWAALLGWEPHAVGEVSEYDGVVYEGGTLLHLDRSRLWYQFEFSAEMQITDEDGWQQSELAQNPHFDGVILTLGDGEPDVRHVAPIPQDPLP